MNCTLHNTQAFYNVEIIFYYFFTISIMIQSRKKNLNVMEKLMRAIKFKNDISFHHHICGDATTIVYVKRI